VSSNDGGRSYAALAPTAAHAHPDDDGKAGPAPGHRILTTSFASIYPHYVTKAERKNRSKGEVDQVISWLTGYDDAGLERALAGGVDELARGKTMTSILRDG
jgi:hypothetical protein